MASPVRRLNARGIAALRTHLEALRRGATTPAPSELLEDPDTSGPLDDSSRGDTGAGGHAEVEPRSFSNRLEVARTLHESLCELERPGIEEDVGLWSWLSLFYFDQVCPKRTGGTRSPGRDYRHILEPGYPNGHRHLLAGAYVIYRLHGEEARLLLCSKLHVENSFHNEIASRQSFISNPSIVAALHKLYQSWPARRPKRGAQKGRDTPGSLRRFVDVVQQLEVNYDLYSMTPETILDILPPEFDSWKPVRVRGRGRKARRKAGSEVQTGGEDPQQTIW